MFPEGLSREWAPSKAAMPGVFVTKSISPIGLGIVYVVFQEQIPGVFFLAMGVPFQEKAHFIK